MTSVAPTFNKFKSTTIYGAFNNLDYEDNTVQASSNIQRNLTVGGDLSCNGIIYGNKLYYNGVDISSKFLQKDISENVSAPLDRNNLNMINNARFSPSCCASGPGSGMSTSMGCACLSNSDAFYITQGRGGGNMNPTEII